MNITTPGRQENIRNILLIVIKNTSVLDYALPLLWKMKQTNSQVNISILYCTLNRRRILRKASFYSVLLNDCKITQYDFGNFLPSSYLRVQGLWRRILSRSNWDSLETNDENDNGFILRKTTRKIKGAVERWIEKLLYQKVHFGKMLSSLNPDVVLFDKRSVIAFYGRRYLYEYLKRAKRKVILLPHAPHHTGTSGFTPFDTPFDKQGDSLPEFCTYWTPFKFDKPWEKIPEKKLQFTYIGYPGLDSEWLTLFRSPGKLPQIQITKNHNSKRHLKCLFIIRKFLLEGEQKPRGHDAYIFDYDEFTYYLNLIGNTLRRINSDTEVVVKPHPSNDFGKLKTVLEKSSIENWQITHEPIYAELGKCDFVISLYSTTLLIPAMAGIPVIVLHSRIQDEIHQWDEIKNLYEGLQFYLNNPGDLPQVLKQVMFDIYAHGETGRPKWCKDIKHLREFYPDGAMQRAIESIKA